MTDDEKIGQLFCLIVHVSDEGYRKYLARDVQPGGLMCRVMPVREIVDTVRVLQTHAKLPMLIAANFEKGGNGITDEGTSLGSPMLIAASDDDEQAYRLGVLSTCRQRPGSDLPAVCMGGWITKRCSG